MENNKAVIAWWSGGITSAVACRLALEKYNNVRLVYIHIDSHHPDTLRFKYDCEKWYGQGIETWQSEKFVDQYDVIKRRRYINGIAGAPCTKFLKKDVRANIESSIDWDHQVWGFEFTKREINRAIRFQEQYPYTNPLFPLIEEGLDKNACAGILSHAGIKIPEMYLMGYNNNNCIGCVKGAAGYWNKIRIDFPDSFAMMAALEREVGGTCLSGRRFLDELDPNAGNASDLVIGDCGLLCQVEFADIISSKTDRIMNREITIYQKL